MEIVKVLAQSSPSAGVLTDIYTVPALSQITISSITICNRSTDVTTFRIAVAVGGAADNANQYVYYNVEIPGKDTFTATIGMTLQATDVIRVYAEAATLSFSVFGILETNSSTALSFTTNKRILGRMSSGAGAPEELPFVLGTTTTTLTGTQSAFDPGAASTIYCNNASLLTIQGILSGFDGQEITFISIGAGQVDFANQHGTPDAENRLINFATVGITSLAAGKGTCRYRYDSTTQRWRLVEHEQGAWINVPYNAGDFTAGGSQTWTVEVADLAKFHYYLKGREMFVVATIQNSSVGGTPNTQLQVKIPGSHTEGSNTVTTAIVYQGTWQVGIVVPSGTVLAIYKDPTFGTNWAASTNTTWVQLQMNFFVS